MTAPVSETVPGLDDIAVRRVGPGADPARRGGAKRCRLEVAIGSSATDFCTRLPHTR